jgi:lipoate-protein ligase A
VTRWRGPAAVAHSGVWPPAPVPSVRLVEPAGPALVLGSTQPPGVVDMDRAAAAGVAVVSRRSGGGAVLVVPGQVVWADVFVPADDRLWVPDVGRATHWLGQVWAGALAALGRESEWHDGPLLVTPWSRLVCFAGLGPGEVWLPTAFGHAAGTAFGHAAGGAKVVGVSQRRARTGALFQCAALLEWDPSGLLDLLALDPAERTRGRAELGAAATGLALPADAVEAAFLERLAGA